MPITSLYLTDVIASFDRVVSGENCFFKKNTVINNWSYKWIQAL